MAPPDGHGLWADEVEAEDAARGVSPPKTFDRPPEWRGHSESGRSAERSGWQPAPEVGGSRAGGAIGGFDNEEGGYTVEGTWHEGMAVERGASRQRLDMRHGFLRHIVSQHTCRFPLLSPIHCLMPWCPPPHCIRHATAEGIGAHTAMCQASAPAAKACSWKMFCLGVQEHNQRVRDEYEQKWQAAYEQGNDYQRRWGRGIKVPETRTG